MTVEQVRDLLTPTYPEMATASLTGPEDMGDVLRYTFNRAIGSKGYLRANSRIVGHPGVAGPLFTVGARSTTH